MRSPSRMLNLYIVAEDCAPPKDDEGIIYVHKGQIFDVMDSTSDWWLARLVRDVLPNSPKFCEQGWIPGSFLDKFEGILGREEEGFILAGKMPEWTSHGVQISQLLFLHVNLKCVVHIVLYVQHTEWFKFAGLLHSLVPRVLKLLSSCTRLYCSW